MTSASRERPAWISKKAFETAQAMEVTTENARTLQQTTTMTTIPVRVLRLQEVQTSRC